MMGIYRCRASSMHNSVLPTAVGPVITMSVFANYQLSIIHYQLFIHLMMPRLAVSMNEQMYSTSFELGYLARASAMPSFRMPWA